MTLQRVVELPPLPERPAGAHKGTFGSVLVIAGSRGMSGAACLAGLGALRGGAGLVFLSVPVGISSIVAAVEPSYLTVALPEDAQGRIDAGARKLLGEQVPRHDAIALGPGIGHSDQVRQLVAWLYSTVERPLIVDADGLNALADIPAALKSPGGPRILTPHPGEFARLSGHTIGTIEKDREKLAADFARHHGLVLLLKGQGTIITDGKRMAVNTTGNSGMATGGAGDVLTGLITALAAQGMPAFEAAQLGAHIHGLAGDLAAEQLSQPGMIASDLPKFLTAAWKVLNR